MPEDLPVANLEEYRRMIQMTAIYRDEVEAVVDSLPREDLVRLLRVFYAATGLAGEAGEVANKIKKILRDNGGVIDDEVRKRVLGELGGVGWYFVTLAEEFGFAPEEVFEHNYTELLGRLNRGVIKGDGDNR